MMLLISNSYLVQNCILITQSKSLSLYAILVGFWFLYYCSLSAFVQYDLHIYRNKKVALSRSDPWYLLRTLEIYQAPEPLFTVAVENVFSGDDANTRNHKEKRGCLVLLQSLALVLWHHLEKQTGWGGAPGWCSIAHASPMYVMSMSNPISPSLPLSAWEKNNTLVWSSGGPPSPQPSTTNRPH